VGPLPDTMTLPVDLLRSLRWRFATAHRPHPGLERTVAAVPVTLLAVRRRYSRASPLPGSRRPVV